jgi:anthranilate synthase component 2
MHGKSSEIDLDASYPLFAGLPPRVSGARYHSLAVIESTLPNELIVTARSDDGEVMGVKHRDFDVYGLQFHPESILTPDGKAILSRFVALESKGAATTDHEARGGLEEQGK